MNSEFDGINYKFKQPWLYISHINYFLAFNPMAAADPGWNIDYNFYVLRTLLLNEITIDIDIELKEYMKCQLLK